MPEEVQDEDEERLNRIQIVVRVRPILPHEASQKIAVTCSADSSSVQVTIPEREFTKPAIAASSRPDAKSYEFDACLTGCTTQAELYDVCGISDLVEAAVDGYNVTVFAFGQTGSGKTYTIVGPSMAGMLDASELNTALGSSSGYNNSSGTTSDSYAGAADGASSAQPPAEGSHEQQQHQQQQQQLGEHEGLLARCVHQLFACINARQDEAACSVLVSCTEVYNEAVTDLLARNKTQQLQVRQDPRTEAFYVEGLTQSSAKTPARALKLLSEALGWRHVRAHKLNSYSSRSHCLITLTVFSQDVGAAALELQQGAKGGMRRCGKLVLVDLAGSERLNSTGNTGVKEAMKETGAINKSLFTLGQVLAALSVRGGCGVTGHVPYRDSRLTQLLWEGLRGGGRVLMLACLCPLKPAADESLNTLHFASMALRIKSMPVVMLDPQDQQVNEMRHWIKTLQEDCRSLAGALAQMSTGADISLVMQSLPPNLVQDALRYGSSSAPPLDQQARHQRPSPNRSLRASARMRKSGSLGNLGKPKAIYANKPATADPLALRRSMPASPYQPSSNGGTSKTKVARSPLTQSWNPGAAVGSEGPLPLLGLGSSGRGSPTPSWGNTAAPGSGGSWPLLAAMPSLQGQYADAVQQQQQQQVAAAVQAGLFNLGPAAYAAGGRLAISKLDAAGGVSFGPSTAAKMFPGSLRQDLYHPGPPGLTGLLSGPPQGSGSKPAWVFSTRTDAQAPSAAGSAQNAAGFPGAAAGGLDGQGLALIAAAQRSMQFGKGGIWSAGVADAVHRRAPQPEAPKLDSFPELAALERQFQLQQQLADEPRPAAPVPAVARMSTDALVPDLAPDVQLMGTNGLLLPSGLPASISAPTSLVPVRLGAADTDYVGMNPDASPVSLALAAADSGVRPIAVPVPANLAETAAAFTSPGAGAVDVMAAGSPNGAADKLAAAAAVQGAEAAADGTTQADPLALFWAEHNLWFGADEDMTRMAYQVHDVLVGEQGIDPSSQLYYTAIESHVAAAFPDKWAHWQQLMAASAIRAGAMARGSLNQPISRPANYTSYRMPLKSPVPKFSSPSRTSSVRTAGQHQQQVAGTEWNNQVPSPGDYSSHSMGNAGGSLGNSRDQPTGLQLGGPTLSQLLQNPLLTAAGAQQLQQQHRQLPDRSLTRQLLQEYQQGQLQPILHQRQQQPQKQLAAAQTVQHLQLSPLQQQQQQRHSGLKPSRRSQEAAASASEAAAALQAAAFDDSLPMLQPSESPLPPIIPTGSPEQPSPHITAAQQEQLHIPPLGTSPSKAAGLLAAGDALGYCSSITSSQSQSRLHQHHHQQQLHNLPGLKAGGISAAASRVLETTTASRYDGSGPLTYGTKPAWANSQQESRVQVGKDLAQVLRSGLNPGNKSLVELQSDYKAARALVLDRLRQQKEAAEAQRKQILLQLGRAISSSAWRP